MKGNLVPKNQGKSVTFSLMFTYLVIVKFVILFYLIEILSKNLVKF